MTLGSNVKALKNFAIAIGIILSLITSCNYWLWIDRQNFFMGLLPEKIEVSSIRYASEKCFFVIFNLSDKSVNEINQQGINFFKDATKARVYDPKRDASNTYHLYQKWQRTPVQDVENNRSFRYGTRCVSEHEFNIVDQSSVGLATISAEGNHSFYTGHSQGQLIVLPSLKIAVISGLGD